MKSASYIILTILAIFFLFPSCINKENIHRLTVVDSIINTVNEAEKKLGEVNYDSIQKKYNLFKEYSELISNNYDLIKNETNWPYMCSYRNVKKPFRDFLADYSFNNTIIDSSKIRLENLKHDIRRNLLTDKEYSDYIVVEKQNAANLIKKVIFRVDNAKKEELNFDTVHPVIVNIFSTINIK